MDQNIILKIKNSVIAKSFIFAILLCLVYQFWLSNLPLVKTAGLKTLDLVYKVNYKLSSAKENTDNIVIVTIDDESYREMELRWPWSRGVIAGIIKKISENKPLLICVDLLFAGESVKKEDDLILAQSMIDAGNVFTAAFFEKNGKYLTPYKIIANSMNSFGLVNKAHDSDYAIRRTRPFVVSNTDEIIDYSLAIKVASYVLNIPIDKLVSRIPILKDNTYYVYFFEKPNNFNTIPVWKIFDTKSDLKFLKDKIVFLGTTAKVSHDEFYTPLGTMPGVFIIINETLALINNNFLKPADTNINFSILFLFVFLAFICGFRLPIIPGIIIFFGEICGFFAILVIFFRANIIGDTIGVFLLLILIFFALYGVKYITLTIENIILKRQAITDGLTNLYLFRYFELKLKSELRKALKEQTPLALAIYDIDHFKKINDTYGHDFGNTALKAIAKILKDNSRYYDTTARFGGEEFCAIMPKMKKEDAVKHCEYLRKKIEDSVFKTSDGKEVKITVSGGIVTTEDYTPVKHSDFLKAADSALYNSKSSGRNRITVFKK